MGVFRALRALGRREGLVASVAKGLPVGVAAAAQRQRPAVVGEGVFLSLVIGDPQADAEEHDAAGGGDRRNEGRGEEGPEEGSEHGEQALDDADGDGGCSVVGAGCAF